MVKVRDEETSERKVAYLVLEDGNVFKGYSFGAEVNTSGEIGKIATIPLPWYFWMSDEISDLFSSLFNRNDG